MEKRTYLHGEITEKIIACALRVHTTLGNGFQEVIYQRALEIEFQNHNLNFKREFSMKVFYNDRQIGTRRVDFLINGCVSLEIKAAKELESVHFAQAQNYLEAYNLEVGLLVNFGEKSLRFKRLENKKYKSA
jgi:GxxExxY protein